MNTKLITLCGAAALAVASTHAASIIYSLSAPVPGANDIANFVGAATDSGNVNDGGVYADGAANDAFTYVAFDRGAMGQTFTTGGFPGGYTINAVWLQHAGYTANTVSTFYMDPAGSHFQIRVTDPAQAGTAGFVLGSETALTTGSEPNTLPAGIVNTLNGTGTWLRFGLSSPVVLNANSLYGFDVSSPNSFGGFGVQPFFETLGTSSDVMAGGGAYTSGPNGSGGDNTLTARFGDRVFLVELTPVPEPATATLAGMAALIGLLVCRRRR